MYSTLPLSFFYMYLYLFNIFNAFPYVVPLVAVLSVEGFYQDGVMRIKRQLDHLTAQLGEVGQSP